MKQQNAPGTQSTDNNMIKVDNMDDGIPRTEDVPMKQDEGDVFSRLAPRSYRAKTARAVSPRL